MRQGTYVSFLRTAGFRSSDDKYFGTNGRNCKRAVLVDEIFVESFHFFLWFSWFLNKWEKVTRNLDVQQRAEKLESPPKGCEIYSPLPQHFTANSYFGNQEETNRETWTKHASKKSTALTTCSGWRWLGRSRARLGCRMHAQEM